MPKIRMPQSDNDVTTKAYAYRRFSSLSPRHRRAFQKNRPRWHNDHQILKMKLIPKRLLLAAAAMACATQAASAAFTYTNGELILGFQASGGTGASENVFFNLGSAIPYRDGTNPGGAIGNISSTLSTVYGAGWYSRTDLYFGVIGNLNGSPNTGPGSAGAVSGDPSRTFYLSSAAATPQSGLLVSGYAGASLGTAGTTLGGMETMLPTLNTTVDGAAILNQTTQPVEWANGWTARNPVGGAAFGVFTGGIQQSFGQGGSATYVDLQRVLSTNTGASPTGVVGGGTYETTFAIGSDGSISAIPEPSTTLLGALGVLALFRRRRA
jgi:hypothetical protein